MPEAISNTSPLLYLYRVQAIEWLPQLFNNVWAPSWDLGDHSYFAYLVVDVIDEWYETLVGKGAEITKPLRNEPWGMREFGNGEACGVRRLEIPPANSLRLSETFASLRETGVRHWVLAGK